MKNLLASVCALVALAPATAVAAPVIEPAPHTQLPITRVEADRGAKPQFLCYFLWRCGKDTW